MTQRGCAASPPLLRGQSQHTDWARGAVSKSESRHRNAFWCSAFASPRECPPKEFTSMSAEAYRRNAEDCLKMSLAAADPETRGLLKRMAIAWTNLAEQALNESPQSIVQQQQQPQSKGLDFDVLSPAEQRQALD